MPKVPDSPKIFMVYLAGCCALVTFVGCQHRAYTDLYTESMAGEVRELEDRIYEYDAAYQRIEQDLAVFQSENSRLHEKLMAIQSETVRPSAGGRSLFKGFQGSESEPNFPGKSWNRDSKMDSPNTIPKISPSPNAVPNQPSKTKSEFSKPSAENLPLPDKAKKKSDDPNFSLPDIVMPSRGNPTLPPSTPASPSVPAVTPINKILFEPNKVEPNKVPFEPIPLKNNLVPFPDAGANNRKPGPLNGAASKTVAISEAILSPEKMPVRLSSVQALPIKADQNTIEAGRIDLPSSIQPATYNSTTHSPYSTPKDDKVIEIGFHPTLCRGQNLDSKEGDDGLYLVLQPRNASGESIDKPATLTVVAMDPNRQEGESKIGRWTFTIEEVEATLEPIGISHGFHIPLKWQESKPLGDSVQIFIRYEIPDGRRLVNERRIQLHIPSAGSANWTPRVAK